MVATGPFVFTIDPSSSSYLVVSLHPDMAKKDNTGIYLLVAAILVRKYIYSYWNFLFYIYITLYLFINSFLFFLSSLTIIPIYSKSLSLVDHCVDGCDSYPTTLPENSICLFLFLLCCPRSAGSSLPSLHGTGLSPQRRFWTTLGVLFLIHIAKHLYGLENFIWVLQ